MKKSSVIIFSVFAVLFITALILILALGAKPETKTNETTGEEFLASSDAIAGQNNSEIDKKIVASDAQGYYLDDSDGWYYNFTYNPHDKYDGTFSAGFDAEHEASIANPQKNFTAGGEWKLENGEVKLFSEGQYRSSMWICEGYIVDSLNYFVGKVKPDEKFQQTILASKAGESGDTQVFNLYSDGKMIVEIFRNDGTMDSLASSDASLEDDIPQYQMFAGTYIVNKDKITITVGDSAQDYYIVNDGIAKWKYIKKN